MHFHAVLGICNVQANRLNVIQQSANAAYSVGEQMFESLTHQD